MALAAPCSRLPEPQSIPLHTCLVEQLRCRMLDRLLRSSYLAKGMLHAAFFLRLQPLGH